MYAVSHHTKHLETRFLALAGSFIPAFRMLKLTTILHVGVMTLRAKGSHTAMEEGP